MRACEFISETVNPETLGDPNQHTGPLWKHEVRIGDFNYKAEHYLGLGDIPGLVISAYDPRKPKGQQYIGKAVFLLHTEEDNEQWLESEDTEVEEEYRNKGVASTMYAYAKMLGNDIKPSAYQSQAGKSMWRQWHEKDQAKHLISGK
jgi:hypothetical protein